MQAFKKIDEDGSGALDLSEVVAALEKIYPYSGVVSTAATPPRPLLPHTIHFML